MRAYLKSIPIGAWAGLLIIVLAIWARDILGVVLGGILAVVTLIATDRAKEDEPPEDDVSTDERFKDM